MTLSCSYDSAVHKYGLTLNYYEGLNKATCAESSASSTYQSYDCRYGSNQETKVGCNDLTEEETYVGIKGVTLFLYSAASSGEECQSANLDVIQTQFASFCEQTYDVNTNSTIFQRTTCSNKKNVVTDTYFADEKCSTPFNRDPTVRHVPPFGKCMTGKAFSDWNGYSKAICQE